MKYEFYEPQPKTTKMVSVPVSFKQKDHAKTLGAKWNKFKGSWQVDETQYEDFMLKFTGKTKLERQIDELDRRIQHDSNDDITIVDYDHVKELEDERNKLYQQLKKQKNN